MRRALLTAIVCAAFASAGAASASGSLGIDRGYGTEGEALLPGMSALHRSNPRAVAIEPGGGLIVATDRTVQRLDPEGRLDTTFGRGGTVAPPGLPGGSFVIAGAAVDAQGRIVVVGTSTPAQPEGKELHVSSSAYGMPTSVEHSDARILRYLPGGVLDPSFGEAGVVETDLGLETPTDEGARLASAPAVEATGVAIDGAGRILLSGGAAAEITGGCFHDDFGFHVGDAALVARLTGSGELDPSFGEGGVLGGRSAAENPLSAEDAAEPLATPDDGLIFRRGAGHCIRRAGALGFVGVTSTGNLGYSAGPDELDGRVLDAAVAADGSVVLLLAPPKSRRDDPEAVEKLRPDGSPDPTFGGDGKVIPRLPVGSYLLNVGVASDGEVLLQGDESRYLHPRRQSEFRARDAIVLVGLGPTGAPDTRFGPKGIATRHVPDSVRYSGRLWLGSEGRATITTSLAHEGEPAGLGAIRFVLP